MEKPLKLLRLAYRSIGEETLVLDTKLNQEVHQLNALGTFIWELCDGMHTPSDITQKVCDEFEVEKNEAENDVLCFLAELQKKSLIEDAHK